MLLVARWNFRDPLQRQSEIAFGLGLLPSVLENVLHTIRIASPITAEMGNAA